LGWRSSSSSSHQISYQTPVGLIQPLAEHPAKSDSQSGILENQLIEIRLMQSQEVNIGHGPHCGRARATRQKGHLTKEITFPQDG